MLKYFNFYLLLVFACVVVNFSQWEAHALPAATTASPPTTHIANYLNRRKTKEKYDEFPEFDFESIKGNYSNIRKQSGVQELFGRLVEQFDMNMDNSIKEQLTAMAKTTAVNTRTTKTTDDLLSANQNTLENSSDIFGNDNHHESINDDANSGNGTAVMWNRTKTSIRVLEPVKHLLNTLRSGELNHTIRQRPHHQLVSPNVGGGNPNDTVIETSEDRLTAVEGPSFQILDFLGVIGNMILGIIKNLFAASASSSSGGSR